MKRGGLGPLYRNFLFKLGVCESSRCKYMNTVRHKYIVERQWLGNDC